jgi:lysophospholipase L1-like esterase
LLVATDRVWLAVLVVGLFLVVFQARALSPRFSQRFDHRVGRVVHAVAHAVGVVLSWVLLSLVFLFVVVPTFLFGLLFRRTPLGRPRGAPGDGWVAGADRGRAGAPQRSFGAEPGWATGKRAPAVLRIATVVVAVLVADVLLGGVLAATGVLPGEKGDLLRSQEQSVGVTMAAPNIGAEPWAPALGEALVDYEVRRDPEYVAYLVRTFQDFHSEHLNVTADGRVSYEPELSAGVEPLRIAFFGGSTMFGVGQRDEHTIPSEFARLAEAEGIPVRVENYGRSGWVLWQEFQYLERLLARGEQYDLVVFYDGFNEFQVQSTDYDDDPTHNGASVMQTLVSDFHEEHETEPGFLDGIAELGDAYVRNSAALRFVDEVWGGDEHAAWLPEGSGSTPEEQSAAAVDIYQRGVRRATDVAGAGEVPVQFFWQPRADGWPGEVLAELPAGVVDISGAYGPQEGEVYIDEVHTNELGARLVAEAMWAELGPGLAQQVQGSGASASSP